MRKFLLVIIVMVTFSIGDIKVNASAGDLTYDIEKMSVSDTSITFEGWAFLNEYNNYGGDNAEIRVYAVGGGKTVDAKIEYNNSKDKSLYEANCVRYKGENQPCIESYENASCQRDGISSCRFDNIGFKATIQFKDIASTIGINTSVTFKISVIVTVSNGRAIGEDYIAVYEKATNNLSNDMVKDGKEYSVKISDLSETATLLVSQGRVLSGTSGGYKQGSSFYWKDEESYFISDVKQSTNAKFSQLKMYQLDYVAFGTACETKITGFASNGAGCKGWAYSTWLRVTGRVTITLLESDKEEPLECDDKDNPELSCEDHYYENSCTYEISSTKKYSIDYESSSLSYCGEDRTKKVYVTGNIDFYQSGSLEFSLDRGPIYSGGGFAFSAYYDNYVYWDFAEEPSKSDCPSKYLAYNCDIVSPPCEDKDGDPKNGEEYCPDDYCSCSYDYFYPDECDTKDEYITIMTNAVTEKYVGLDDSEMNVTLPDSNSVGAESNTDVGKWDCDVPNVNTWKNGVDNAIESTCTFTMYDAYINKETSEVVYGSKSLTKYLDGNDENGNPLYYIPLKWPNGNFAISASLSGLSSISFMEWGAEYNCDVECQQKFYNQYYFRPIALSNPFPGRTPGENWIDWIKDSDNVKRLLNTYTNENNLEYIVTLTNTDIANIKSHNENALYGGGRGYLDYSIDRNGNSEFIKTYNEFIDITNNVTHSALGKYNAEDDRQ